jgi:hypothetical protein
MLEKFSGNKFTYKKLSPQEQKERGILGRLVGVIADFKNPTRNGRGYSEELWDNVFEDPIMKEKIANRCVLGELGHPADRTEIDIEKAAICMAEQPKKGPDGKIYGVFDILSTPNGKILKSLCDYGCNIAISSRGQGDLITDDEGNEAVDPDTYECETWDAVLVPGVESARLKYVNEGLENKKSLKAVLTESLNKADEDEKKVMEESLKNLGININEDDKKEDVKVDEKKDGKEDDIDIDDVAEESEDKETEEGKEDNAEEGEDTAEVEIEQPSEEVDDKASEEVAAEPVEKADDEPSGDTPTDADIETGVEEDPKELLTAEDKDNIFLDVLATKFDEDKVREVCKILDIEVVDDETDADKSADAVEKPAEDEIGSEADEKPADDIDDSEKESDEAEEKEDSVDNVQDEALVNSLKEALKVKSDLENEIKNLQEKLAVSDSKVNEAYEECNRYKSAVTRLSTLAKSTKDLKESVSTLEKSLAEKDETIAAQSTRISKLVESRKTASDLNESLSSKDAQVKTLTENLAAAKKEADDKIAALNESLEKKEKEKNEAIAKETALKESYKKLANKAVGKYIESKANILGVSSKDITRKLGKTYTLDDVDQVCEDLKAYQLNVSKLPFSLDRKVGIKVNEGVNRAPIAKAANKNLDDDVDDDLIRLANVD